MLTLIKYRNILKKGSYNTLAISIYRIGMLAMYLLAGNTMSISDFAYVTSVMTLAVTFQMLGTSGITNSFNRYSSKYMNNNENLRKYQSSLFLILFLLIIVLLISINIFLSLVVDSVYANMEMGYKIFLCFFLICSVASAGLKGVFYANEKFYELFLTSLLSFTFLIGSYLILILLDMDMKLSFIISIFLATLAELISYLVYSRKLIYFDFLNMFNKEINKKVLCYLIPSSLSSIIVSPVNIYLVDFVSEKGTKSELALINVVLQIKNILIFIPSAFASLALSSITKSKNYKEEAKNLIIFIITCLAILIPLSLLFILFSEYIFNLYGFNSDLNFTSIMTILVLGTIVMAICLMIGQFLNAKGKTIIGLLCNVIWVFSLITLLNTIINEDTIENILFVKLLSYLILLVLLTTYSVKVYLNEKKSWNSNNVV